MGRRPGSAGLRGQIVASVLLAAGIVAGSLGLTHLDATADELLQNGAFESWAGASPTGWSTLAGTTSREDARSESGASLHVTGASGEAVVQQTVAAYPSAAVSASIAVSVDSTADVTLSVYPLDEDYFAKGTPIVTMRTIVAGDAFTTISETTAPMPPWVANARIQVSIKPIDSSAGLSVYLDSASLSEDKPLPTATPTATATPTSEPTDPTSSRTAGPTGTAPTGDASDPTATHTTSVPSPTKTPTPKPPPTPKRPANTPTRTPQPKRTPTPTNPDASMNGLILNGDFEALDNGKPAYWAKYGGEMGASSNAYDGAWSATLNSETSSTKWLNQVVPVEGGGWYKLTATARAENATAFLRVSWYAAADGSGSALDSADGDATDSDGWTLLATDAIQAPDAANSARVKLMLRPGPGSGRVMFDDVFFVTTSAAAATATPPASATHASTTATRTPSLRATHGATPTKTPKATKTTVKSASGSKATPGHAPAASVSGIHGGAASAGAGVLRISEFMSDPPRTGSDAQDEWVEVVNVSTAAVSTAGWKISDAKTSDDLPVVEVPSGGYLVIAGKSAELPDGVAVVRVADGTIGSGLNNAGDVIALVNPAGETTDAISYGDNADIFEPPPPAPGAGKTLGSRAPAADEAAENWDITLAPTPGQPNSFADTPPGEATATGNTDTDIDDPSVREAPPGRALVPGGKHTGGGLGTLEWILLGGGLMVAGATVPVTVKRFGPALWTRLHRDR